MYYRLKMSSGYSGHYMVTYLNALNIFRRELGWMDG